MVLLGEGLISAGISELGAPTGAKTNESGKKVVLWQKGHHQKLLALSILIYGFTTLSQLRHRSGLPWADKTPEADAGVIMQPNGASISLASSFVDGKMSQLN